MVSHLQLEFFASHWRSLTSNQRSFTSNWKSLTSNQSLSSLIGDFSSPVGGLSPQIGDFSPPIRGVSASAHSNFSFLLTIKRLLLLITSSNHLSTKWNVNFLQYVPVHSMQNLLVIYVKALCLLETCIKFLSNAH